MDVSAVTTASSAIDRATGPTDRTGFAEQIANAATGRSTYVDAGPGGSGAVFQLDGNGRIICECSECNGPPASVRQPASAEPSEATATALPRIADAAFRRALAAMFRDARLATFE